MPKNRICSRLFNGGKREGSSCQNGPVGRFDVKGRRDGSSFSFNTDRTLIDYGFLCHDLSLKKHGVKK